MFGQMLKATTILDSKLNPTLCDNKLSNAQLASLEELSNLEEFSGLIESMEQEEGKWS